MKIEWTEDDISTIHACYVDLQEYEVVIMMNLLAVIVLRRVADALLFDRTVRGVLTTRETLFRLADELEATP